MNDEDRDRSETGLPDDPGMVSYFLMVVAIMPGAIVASASPIIYLLGSVAFALVVFLFRGTLLSVFKRACAALLVSAHCLLTFVGAIALHGVEYGRGVPVFAWLIITLLVYSVVPTCLEDSKDSS